jgi:hypothetical protein
MPKGPCNLCGLTDYPLSMGGPTICPSCDCGIDPQLSKCRNELWEANEALGKATATIERLRKYAQHHDTCASVRLPENYSHECNCGLQQALDAARGDE